MKKATHKILALKYRPQNFEELIGQDIMVETITNSIKLNKLPNAYLLTGIRGIGKTTTARLIAKGINCNKDFIQGEKCSAGEFCHCEEISSSKHLDVLEMDAASKTGIDDVRGLIESSKYNPTSAKYKIIILDEATSSVDSHSEQLIQKATKKITQGRTSIIIAHRLATIKKASKIIVMDKGNIVEQGTHKELLEKENGYYKNLYEIQFQEDLV